MVKKLVSLWLSNTMVSGGLFYGFVHLVHRIKNIYYYVYLVWFIYTAAHFYTVEQSAYWSDSEDWNCSQSAHVNNFNVDGVKN